MPPQPDSKAAATKRLSVHHPRPVVPVCLVNILIDRMHAGPSGAQVGPSRVLATLQRKYHVKNMQQVVVARISQCIPCQLSMHSSRSSHDFQLTTHEEVPRRTVALDMAVDLPRVQGWNHILVLMDLASNHLVLRPMKTKTSKELAQRLAEYMGIFGIPERIRHDQERGMMGMPSNSCVKNTESHKSLVYQTNPRRMEELKLR